MCKRHKKSIIGELIISTFIAFYPCLSSALKASETCVILDNYAVPDYITGGTIIWSADYEGGGDCAFLEIKGDWNKIIYLDNAPGGTIDMGLRFLTTFFIDSDDGLLPEQVGKILFDTVWTFRLGSGIALQPKIMPGIYSDMENMDKDMFSLPFSLTLIKTWNSQISGYLGAEIRTDFERELIPLLGLVCEPSDNWRFEIGIPHTRIMYLPNPNSTFYVDMAWQNTSYFITEGHDRWLTLEDIRCSLGLIWRIVNELHIGAEAGYAFERTIEIEEAYHRPPIDIDNAIFYSLSVISFF